MEGDNHHTLGRHYAARMKCRCPASAVTWEYQGVTAMQSHWQKEDKQVTATAEILATAGLALQLGYPPLPTGMAQANTPSGLSAHRAARD